MNKRKTIYLVIVFAIGLFTFNSCNNEDDACTKQSWYQDSDEDGFGNPNISEQSCTQSTGYISDNTDFNDMNATAYPGAEELCDDGIDNNGNGEIDDCSILNPIVGSWSGSFGGMYTITNTTIVEATNNYTYHILVSRNNYVICLNDENNPFYAGSYSKFVVTNISTNTFNLCQPFFDEDSQEFIENANDPTDIDDLEAGCGGFAWTLMTRN